MGNVDGVRITLPDGTTFFGQGNLSINAEQSRSFVLSGGDRATDVFKRHFDNDGAGIQTPLATGYLGGGAGQRRFEIAFDQWSGSADQWGPADPDDSVAEKLAVLEREIADAAPDSLNPATLEFGPYSATTSRYDPIPVVFPTVQPSFDFGNSETLFQSRLTAAEAADLTAEIDGDGSTPDFELTPLGATQPAVGFSRDTTATTLQTIGQAIANGNLVDPNGQSGSDPTTLVSSLLPEQIQLSGAFRGANALSLAKTLKNDILGDDSVQEVDLQAPGVSPDPAIVGTYALGGDSRLDPIDGRVDGVYGFVLDLRQVQP